MLNDFRFVRVSTVIASFIVIATLFVAGCGSGPAKPAVSVALSPAGPVTLEQGGTASITAAVTNDSTSAGVTWSLTGAGSLTGNTTTTVTYNAPASISAASTATVKATSVTDSTKSATFTVNLVPPPAIAQATLPGGNVGTSYSQSVSVTSGIGPYTWSITGTQIAGVTFTAGATSATLAGIPTTAATYNFTVSVKDSANPQQTASMTYNVVIGAELPLSITTSSLPAGAFNAAYGPVQIGATGGFAPYSFGAIGLPPGLTLSSGGSLSGTPTAAGSFSVTITVTDSGTVPATASVTLPLTITVSPLVLSPGTGSLPNATQNAAYTTSITPSGGIGPYSITLDPTSTALPAGLTFNATVASAAAATITGTPTTVGNTTGIIVDVVDSESPAVTTQVTYSLSVVVPCGTGSESLLSGQYAFVLSGFDSTGNVALIGGVLTASGTSGSSNLTAGAVDMNLSGGVQTNLAIASGSNYTVGSDGRGCMAITTSAGTQNYRFSLGASGNGHMIDFDTAGPFTTGVLRKQTTSAFSTAQITGNYAFGVASPLDSAQGGGKFAAMGVLNLSAGSVTGGSVDSNHYNLSTLTDKLDGVVNTTGTWPASPIAISSGGSYTVGTNGRGTLSFTPSGGTATNSYVYVVSSTELLIIDADARTVNQLFAGTAFQQSGGPYSGSSLNGKSVIYNSNVSSNGGLAPTSSVQVGIVSFTGGSNFSYSGFSNGGGNIQTPTNNSATGTFSVASNGRVTLTVNGTGNTQIPAFYLFSPGSAFAVFSGTGVDNGLMQSQTTTSVTNGTYTDGTIDPQTAGVSDKVGVATLNGGNVTAATDDSNSQGSLSPNNAGTGTYTVDSTGVMFIPASCTPGATTGTICEKIGTVVTGSKIILMDAKPSGAGGTTNPSLQVADQ